MPTPTSIDAEDLCQEFWGEMLRRKKLMLGHYDRIRPLGPLLTTIVSRVMARKVRARRLRQQDRAVHLDQQRLNELPDHREEVEEVMDPSVKLSQMLAGTNQEVRAILYARFGMESGKELTYEQLADQLRCSLWQAFRIVQRALEELRDIKKPPEDD